MRRRTIQFPNKDGSENRPQQPMKRSQAGGRMLPGMASNSAGSLDEANALFMPTSTKSASLRAVNVKPPRRWRPSRRISRSREFFAKNRHLLGFDNPRKALLTTVKEAVDNSLDACEEAGILPNVTVVIEDLQPDRPANAKQSRYRVTVVDNGPGIVRKQVENVFGRLLFGIEIPPPENVAAASKASASARRACTA